MLFFGNSEPLPDITPVITTIQREPETFKGALCENLGLLMILVIPLFFVILIFAIYCYVDQKAARANKESEYSRFYGEYDDASTQPERERGQMQFNRRGGDREDFTPSTSQYFTPKNF